MNCLIVDDDRICRTLLEKYIAQTELFTQKFSMESAVEALAFLHAGKVKIDILFLDIEMPDMTGIDLLDDRIAKEGLVVGDYDSIGPHLVILHVTDN